MLLFNFYTIGNKLYNIRKSKGMTRAEVAEAANLSDRTYADIERGSVNMRTETILRICQALQITPDEILTEEDPDYVYDTGETLVLLEMCSPRQRQTALRLMNVYLESIGIISPEKDKKID